MSTLLFDLRQALRSLLRSPGFLITAKLCLALGIGANLAVASHVDRLVLHPLPFPHRARLAVIEPLDNQTGETGAMTMAACTARTRTLTGLGEPLQRDVSRVTADLFGVLGGEDRPGAHRLPRQGGKPACLIPALRAARVNPADALRSE